jgi:hypothetical protein
MRLLRLEDNSRFQLDRFQKEKIPPYATLSHTWGRGEVDEVTYKDIMYDIGNNKPSFKELEFCGNQAKDADLHYFWVDTCS